MNGSRILRSKIACAMRPTLAVDIKSDTKSSMSLVEVGHLKRFGGYERSLQTF
jgi:hypothetical protein